MIASFLSTRANGNLGRRETPRSWLHEQIVSVASQLAALPRSSFALLHGGHEGSVRKRKMRMPICKF